MTRRTIDADQINGIAALTHGDPKRARELRTDLAVFARRTDNPVIRRMVADVLAAAMSTRSCALPSSTRPPPPPSTRSS